MTVLLETVTSKYLFSILPTSSSRDSPEEHLLTHTRWNKVELVILFADYKPGDTLPYQSIGNTVVLL